MLKNGNLIVKREYTDKKDGQGCDHPIHLFVYIHTHLFFGGSF